RMNVDVIFAPSSTMVEPARQATKTIPIVFSNHADPVGIGHVASLARPGGNVTGLSMLLTDLAVKELEILTEASRRRSGLVLCGIRQHPPMLQPCAQSRTPVRSSASVSSCARAKRQ